MGIGIEGHVVEVHTEEKPAVEEEPVQEEVAEEATEEAPETTEAE